MWNLILCTFLTYLVYLLLGGGMFMLLDDLEGVHQKPPNMSNSNFTGKHFELNLQSRHFAVSPKTIPVKFGIASQSRQ